MIIVEGFEHELGTYTLLAGDIDNSGEIEIDDLVTLNNNYGKTDNICDLNEDGTVDTLDREILKSNYGKLSQVTDLGTPYKLAYDANEGTGAPGGIIQYGNNVFTISTIVPTRDGYTFQGWYQDVEGTGTSYSDTITVDGNKTLYAKWKSSIVTPEDIAENPTAYYGKYVTNYVPTNGDTATQWRVFYADSEEDKLYLISAERIHKNYWPKTKNGSSMRAYSTYNYTVCYLINFIEKQQTITTKEFNF